MLHVLNILKASFGNKFICKLHLSRILLHFSRSSYNYWLTRSATGGMCHLPNLTKKEHWPSMETHIAQFLQREWLKHYKRPFWQYKVKIKNKTTRNPHLKSSCPNCHVSTNHNISLQSRLCSKAILACFVCFTLKFLSYSV